MTIINTMSKIEIAKNLTHLDVKVPKSSKEFAFDNDNIFFSILFQLDGPGRDFGWSLCSFAHHHTRVLLLLLMLSTLQKEESVIK